jgi:hypothetical protein
VGAGALAGGIPLASPMAVFALIVITILITMFLRMLITIFEPIRKLTPLGTSARCGRSGALVH